MANKADIAKLTKKIEKQERQIQQLNYALRKCQQEERESASLRELVQNLVEALTAVGDFCTKKDLERATSDLELNLEIVDGA